VAFSYLREARILFATQKAHLMRVLEARLLLRVIGRALGKARTVIHLEEVLR
jgi:hypothetical protein